MAHGLWTYAAAAVLAAPAFVHAQPDAGNEHAKARLVSERQALTPGATNDLGVTFEIADGWHLYWKGTNDTGFPINVDLVLPEGYTLGEIQWPAPKRYLVPGGMLDHVYEGRVTLVLPVHVPSDASGEVRIYGTTEFLVCQDVCLPGGGPLELTIAVGGDGAAKESSDARRFAEARQRIPKPLPRENPPISWRLDGNVMEITSLQGKTLSFYPAEDCIELEDARADAVTKTGKLRLRLKDMSFGPRVRGVLEIKPDAKEKGARGAVPGDKGEAKIYAIDLPIAEAAPPLAAPDSKNR
jgi:DsbC/DsbD-like thiol-disulfide interchange protein